MFIFALSSQITVAGHKILELDWFYFEINFINKIANTFRSSGRFIWPLYYLLAIYFIAFSARIKKFGLWLLLGALFLQIYDLKDFHQERITFDTAWQEELETRKISAIAQNYKHLALMPHSVAFAKYAFSWQQKYFEIAHLAAKEGLSFNSGSAARLDYTHINNFYDKFLDKPQINKNTLYIVHPYLCNTGNINQFNPYFKFYNQLKSKAKCGIVETLCVCYH